MFKVFMKNCNHFLVYYVRKVLVKKENLRNMFKVTMKNWNCYITITLLTNSYTGQLQLAELVSTILMVGKWFHFFMVTLSMFLRVSFLTKTFLTLYTRKWMHFFGKDIYSTQWSHIIPITSSKKSRKYNWHNLWVPWLGWCLLCARAQKAHNIYRPTAVACSELAPIVVRFLRAHTL